MLNELTRNDCLDLDLAFKVIARSEKGATLIVIEVNDAVWMARHPRVQFIQEPSTLALGSSSLLFFSSGPVLLLLVIIVECFQFVRVVLAFLQGCSLV